MTGLYRQFVSQAGPATLIYGDYVSLALDWTKVGKIFDLRLPIRLDWEAVALLNVLLLVRLVLTLARARIALRARVRLPRFTIGTAALAPLAFGAALAMVNLGGLAAHLRRPDLRPGVKFANHGPGDMVLSEEAARNLVQCRPGETDEAYAHRLTLVIADAISHTWPPYLADRFRLRVPIWENYLLWAKGGLVANQTPYIFVDPDKALERGVGHCGQVAVLLTGLLHRAGVKASIVLLDGHGLVSAEVRPGVHQVLDPDFAAVMPFKLQRAQNVLSATRHAYRPGLEHIGFAGIDGWLDRIEAIYRRPGGRLATIEEYLGSDHVHFEWLAYQLKWPLPIALMLLGGGLMLLDRRRRRVRVERTREI